MRKIPTLSDKAVKDTTAAAFQLAFEGYSRPADTFNSDAEWAIWQHTKLTRIFELLQKEHLETDSLENAKTEPRQ